MEDNGNRSGVLLKATGLTKTFGGLAAVKDVSFTIRPGIIKAIIGPNGAGKTTLYDLLTGIYLPDNGSVIFEEREIIGLPSHVIAAMGIGRTFQTIRLFTGMTVIENIMVGLHHRTKAGMWQALVRWPSARREEAWMRQEAMRYLDMVGLEMQASNPAGSLPFGQQRLLEVARALALDDAVGGAANPLIDGRPRVRAERSPHLGGEVEERHSPDPGARPDEDLGVPVLAEHERVHGEGGHAEVLSEECAEARRVEDGAGADDAPPGATRGLGEGGGHLRQHVDGVRRHD